MHPFEFLINPTGATVGFCESLASAQSALNFQLFKEETGVGLTKLGRHVDQLVVVQQLVKNLHARRVDLSGWTGGSHCPAGSVNGLVRYGDFAGHCP